MANVFEPTEEQRRAWRDFVESRPARVREAIESRGLVPWKLYRMKPTGQRVTLYSVDEPEDEAAPCTLKVDVLGEFNVVAFERRVFGVAPGDLEECDLPAPSEPVGSANVSVDEVLAALRAHEGSKPS